MDSHSGGKLFRNAREPLANVVKHSEAGSVLVLIERAGDNLELTVRDDGKGCDPATRFGHGSDNRDEVYTGLYRNFPRLKQCSTAGNWVVLRILPNRRRR